MRFACGLAKNPSVIVERVSELFVDSTLGCIDENPAYHTGYSETDPLITIAKEVEHQGISPFCNRYLHYVLQPGIPMRSQMHIFGREIPPMWTVDAYQKTRPEDERGEFK